MRGPTAPSDIGRRRTGVAGSTGHARREGCEGSGESGDYLCDHLAPPWGVVVWVGLKLVEGAPAVAVVETAVAFPGAPARDAYDESAVRISALD